MNDKGIRGAIRRRVESLPDDAAFTASDFADVSGSANARQALKGLADSGAIARAARGVYYKPRYSELLGRPVPPDIDAVAHAIARARGWEIVPSGDHALNMLGLDTQVPAVYSYISTGPYASVLVAPFEVRFSHAANRNIVGMSPLTALVVQALKALGREGVDDKVINRLSGRLSTGEKGALLAETERATAWVRDAIAEIAKGCEDDRHRKG
ncbi:DUF6088 family protein [Olsenella phocaeensis]|uniref:DUF6088 family protein n=1 Tax=Olsenella phocaeensis TaxID=1852385 RepID=UPI000930E637|nr:DUF6088 family protein [Olsenella phocaeensis]